LNSLGESLTVLLDVSTVDIVVITLYVPVLLSEINDDEVSNAGPVRCQTYHIGYSYEDLMTYTGVKYGGALFKI